VSGQRGKSRIWPSDPVAAGEVVSYLSDMVSSGAFSPVTFREGTPEDLDRVTAKVHEFAPKMLRSLGASEEQIDEWLMFYASRNRWRKRLGSDSAAVFLGERDDELVGIGYVQTFLDIDNVLAARFGGLYMRYTRQGIGTAIMKERLRKAKQLKADYIQLETAENNEIMCRMAEKYGFTVHERYQHTILTDIPFLKYRRALTDVGEDYLLDIGDS
jgi:RimJ/RimL family protein N-acetyltransferase